MFKSFFLDMLNYKKKRILWLYYIIIRKIYFVIKYYSFINVSF